MGTEDCLPGLVLKERYLASFGSHARPELKMIRTLIDRFALPERDVETGGCADSDQNPALARWWQANPVKAVTCLPGA